MAIIVHLRNSGDSLLSSVLSLSLFPPGLLTATESFFNLVRDWFVVILYFLLPQSVLLYLLYSAITAFSLPIHYPPHRSVYYYYIYFFSLNKTVP